MRFVLLGAPGPYWAGRYGGIWNGESTIDAQATVDREPGHAGDRDEGLQLDAAVGNLNADLVPSSWLIPVGSVTVVLVMSANVIVKSSLLVVLSQQV